MCSTVLRESRFEGPICPRVVRNCILSWQPTSSTAQNFKSESMTSSKYTQLLFWSGTESALHRMNEAHICRCAQMCRTAPLENNQGHSAVLPPPPYSKLHLPWQALFIPFQDASHSFSSTTDIPPSPKRSLIWSKSLTGVLNLVFLCSRDNITRKYFICIRGDD